MGWNTCTRCDVWTTELECPKCGNPIGPGALERRFGAVPLTFLDPRKKNWQERKRKWHERGIKEDAEDDPHLCALMYRWFAPKWGGHVLDPFAGDATKGIVAAYCGFRFTGIVGWPEEASRNQRELEAVRAKAPPHRAELLARAKWICGGLPEGERYDLIFTTVPRHIHPGIVDQYLSGCACTLSAFENTPRSVFWPQYEEAWAQSIARLKDNRSVVVNIGDARPHDGYDHHTDTVKLLSMLGLGYYNRAVLATEEKYRFSDQAILRAKEFQDSMQRRMRAVPKGSREEVRLALEDIRHWDDWFPLMDLRDSEMLLVFWKGDDLKLTRRELGELTGTFPDPL